jgi:hypothetical protein
MSLFARECHFQKIAVKSTLYLHIYSYILFGKYAESSVHSIEINSERNKTRIQNNSKFRMPKSISNVWLV